MPRSSYLSARVKLLGPEISRTVSGERSESADFAVALTVFERARGMLTSPRSFSSTDSSASADTEHTSYPRRVSASI